MNTRPDSYVLSLNAIKIDFNKQLNGTLRYSSRLLDHIILDPNYATAATDKEKQNIAALSALVSQAKIVLEQITW